MMDKLVMSEAGEARRIGFFCCQEDQLFKGTAGEL